MSDNHYQNATKSQFIGQWITSLAISVVCCAVLFVLFAGYMVRLQDRASSSEIRIELMQEKYTQLVSEMQSIRRTPPSTVFNLQGVAPVAATPPVEAAPVGVVPAVNNVPVPEADAPATTSNGYVPAPTHDVDLGVPAFEAPVNNTPIVR